MPTKKNQRDGVFERKDRKGWWVSYVDSAGVRRKQKVEAHTRTQALNTLSALKTRAQTERVLGVKHQSDILTADLLTRYKRHQKALLKPSTYERLQSILVTLAARMPERLKDVSKASVAAFVSARSESVSPGTVQKETSVLKHALRLAVEWELIHTNPADRVRLPRLPEGRTRYLSPPELRSVLDACPEWMRAPIALAAFTGMRRGELLNLLWRDVDLTGRRVYLHDTKNGSLRVLALNDLAAGVLASLPAGGPGQLVLVGVDGPKLSVYTKRIMASVGIADGSFHTLRHTAAS